VHGQIVAYTFTPRMFNQTSFDIFKKTAETAHRILCKVVTHYLEDPEYRKVFNFDPRMEELILLPRGYDSVIPFARVDTFYNEDTGRIMFCEFNGAGYSGM
ncbi:MAG: carboxylate--amine ligase, partial [Eggerthellaceae bacterium]|nr:carboxylate--amine ligase [Eggerthellaceae bacterium]